MQHSYPSPTVDGQDNSYYGVQREQEMQNIPDGLPSAQEHQQLHGQLSGHADMHSEDENHDLQALQELREDSVPHGNPRHASVSAEELQLAAQLTQDLAPMMAAHNQAHNHELQDPQLQQSELHDPQLQDSQHQHGGTGLQGQDPNLQEHIQAQLQSHEQQLHAGIAQDGQPHGHSAYHQDGPPPPPPLPHSLPHHLPLDQLGQVAQYGISDNIPPRKRSKVSRACDECRRKKIKCDAASDQVGEEPCSNCRRSHAQCLFSRVPQKRGPSKGQVESFHASQADISTDLFVTDISKS